jgi:heterodisulfide reductase subunit A-like polyferredoxin
VAGDEAGIESARNIADDGYKVYLILRQPSLVGLEAGDNKAYPPPFNPDSTECWIGPENVIDVCRHPNITLLTCSESDSRVVFMENV